MADAASIIPELEEAVQHGSPERRGDILERVTTLFLEGASRFNEEHIHLFDDVFSKLIEEIETKARAELSRRLAPVANAPREVVRRLARDDDIAVAGPVLAQSLRLADEDLLDIAGSKGQGHLFAISGRNGLGESITDILVDRGDRDVVRKVASNPGARFSDSGFTGIVKRAEKDEVLAETVAQRPDIPDQLFRELLVRATQVVQRRLLAAAKPETQAEIRRVMAKVSGEVGAAANPSRDYAEALRAIRSLHVAGRLGEEQLVQFASEERYEDMIAALSELCRVPVEVVDRLMGGERPDPILILCKATGFGWPTARAMILARPGPKGKSSPALDAACANFDRLSASTAQRVVRFWQVGRSAVRAAS